MTRYIGTKSLIRHRDVFATRMQLENEKLQRDYREKSRFVDGHIVHCVEKVRSQAKVIHADAFTEL